MCDCGGQCKSCTCENTDSHLWTTEEYQQLRKETPIQSAIVNITDACNLRCPYCFTEQNKSVITLETLQQVVRFLFDEFQRTGGGYHPNIAFFGGEPMLHFDDLIVPFVRWCEDNAYVREGLTFNITSNGTLYNEQRLRFMYGHRIVPLLSIDGAKPTQDNQRPAAGGKSSFDLVEPNLPFILRFFPDTTFRSTLEPWNADKIIENYMFARNTGFKHYFITPNIFSKWSAEDAQTAFAQLAGVTMIFYEDLKANNVPCVPDFFVKDLKSVGENPTPVLKKFVKRCGLGTVSMGVGCDGKINGCQEHNTYHHDTIFDIGNIWTGIDPERHIALLNAYAETDTIFCADDPDRCKSCKARAICTSNFCPSSNLNRNGKLAGNALITCMWREFFMEYCPTFLAMVEKENNYSAKSNLMELMRR